MLWVRFDPHLPEQMLLLASRLMGEEGRWRSSTDFPALLQDTIALGSVTRCICLEWDWSCSPPGCVLAVVVILFVMQCNVKFVNYDNVITIAFMHVNQNIQYWNLPILNMNCPFGHIHSGKQGYIICKWQFFLSPCLTSVISIKMIIYRQSWAALLLWLTMFCYLFSLLLCFAIVFVHLVGYRADLSESRSECEVFLTAVKPAPSIMPLNWQGSTSLSAAALKSVC